MSKRTCEHIPGDGLRCTNPAMYRREICFHHWRQLRPSAPPSDPAYVPSFDSEASISIASAHMFRSVLAGKVDLKQARLALHFLRETARSLRRQRKIGDKSEIHFTSFMADYYSTLDEIQAKSAAAYPDPQPLIYPAYFRDIPEDYDDDAVAANDVGTGAPARAARAQLAVSTAGSTTAAEGADLLDNVGTGFQARVSAAPAAEKSTPKKPPLSATQAKLLKKILRRGPKHPQFHLAARLLDHQIAGGR